VILLPSVGIVGASIASTVGYAVLNVGLIVWALRVGGMSARDALLPQADDVRTLRALGARIRGR
jgi:hypothetical protein